MYSIPKMTNKEVLKWCEQHLIGLKMVDNEFIVTYCDGGVPYTRQYVKAKSLKKAIELANHLTRGNDNE
jgi:hypothetical protein